MVDALILRVKANLKRQCYLMNDSWLRECVEYYTSENDDVSQNAIENFVTTQWLLCDLREINNENGYLPRNFSQQEMIVLPGRYMFQVDKMYDISQSKYSQLQKIRNVSEINIKATSTETPAWEPKGKRMMQMFLTDGIQEFIAIEYMSIRTLKDMLLPGFKIMITGPVTCRKGVMMLREENYKEIGGEVESLLKVNALENVLARSLDLEENENPYGDENQVNNELRTAANQLLAAENPVKKEHKTETIEFPDDEFDIDLDEITQIERLSMEAEDFPTNQPNGRAENPRNEQPASSRERGVAKKIKNEFWSGVTNNPQILQRSKSGENQSTIESRVELKPLIAQPTDFEFPEDDFPMEECFDAADFENELDETELRGNRSEDREAGQGAPKIQTVKKEIKSANPPITKRSAANPAEKRDLPTVGKRSADILSPVNCSAKMIRLQTTSHASKGNRKITEFAEKILPKEDPPPKICEFICDVMKTPPVKIAVFKTVRGKVISIGNLTKKNKNWDLKATITDSTANLEVEFANQVLEDWIGFTVAEFSQKRKLRKTNAEIEEYLRKGFRTAEIRVQRMDALMDLELSTENSLPRVISTRELTEEQKNLIEKRLKMMKV